MRADFVLSIDDLNSFDWGSVLQDVPERTCNHYCQAFLDAAQNAKANGDERLQNILLLFSDMTSMMLQPSGNIDLFTPMATFTNGARTSIISDFTVQHLDVLKEWVVNCTDPELKARIADIIWTRKHQGNFKIAEIAVVAYLDSGKQLLKSEFPHQGVERLIRSTHLAANLGRGNSMFPLVIKEIEELIDKYAKDNSHFIIDLMNLLGEFNQGDPTKYIPISESIALNHEAAKNWYLARIAWEEKVKWHRKTREQSQVLDTMEKIAATFIFEAKEVIDNKRGYIVAAHCIQSAIEIFRQIPGKKDKQNDLHKLLLEYEELSNEEMGHYESEAIDLTPEIHAFYARIKDKSFQDAILTLAMGSAIVSKKGMKEMVDDITKNSPFYSLASSNIVNEEGKVIGKRGSILTGTEKEIQQAKNAEMDHWANLEVQARGAVIENARRFLLTEHNPTLQDFSELLSYNPFIPPNRQLIFAKGFFSGVQGDFIIALHLLLPQVENSVRYLLHNSGVITTGINPDGVQEEFPLEKLFDMPETSKIFHEDIIFGLRETLTSRFGSNFRNLLAHGLLEDGQFYTYTAVYIWWLILKICCMPIVTRQESKNAPTKE